MVLAAGAGAAPGVAHLTHIVPGVQHIVDNVAMKLEVREHGAPASDAVVVELDQLHKVAHVGPLDLCHQRAVALVCEHLVREELVHREQGDGLGSQVSSEERGSRYPARMGAGVSASASACDNTGDTASVSARKSGGRDRRRSGQR